MTRPYAYAISAVGTLIAIALVYYYAHLVRGAPLISDWLAHQFFFNYQDLGFVRRGLFGSILYFFPASLTTEGLKVVSLVMALICIILFWIYFYSATHKMHLRDTLLLALCVVASPGLFMHMGYDLGRYDWIGLSLLIGSIYFIEKGQYVLLSLASVIGILTHEAYFLIFLPSVVGIFLLQHKSTLFNNMPWGKLIAIFSPALITYLLLTLFGATEFENGEAIRQHLNLYNPYFRNMQYTWAYDDPFDVLIRDFRENSALVIEYFGAKGIIPKSYLLIAAIWILFHCAMIVSLLKANQLTMRFWFIAAISPLFLNFIAVDYARFCALASITTTVMFLYIIKNERPTSRIPIVPAALLIASGLLGPIGEIWIFPRTITPGF